MKTCRLFFLIFLSSIQFLLLLPASAQQNERPLKEAVSDILTNTKETNERLSSDVQALFDGVKKSISDANKIYNKLDKKYSNKESLTTGEKEELLNIMREIHSMYKRIDENRDILHNQLLQYNDNLDLQSERTKGLVFTYKRKLRESESLNSELITKSELTEIEKQDLEFSKINIIALDAIVKKLEKVQGRVEQIKRDYQRANDEITMFFNTIKNATETTKNLVDYFEFDLEFDKILKNTENIKNLNDLTKGITNSLLKLSESINELREASKTF